MKHRKIVISLILVAVLTQAVGAILNLVVISNNGGMPTIAYPTIFGNWVSINQGTKFAFLSDVIRLGYYAISVGDLVFITGIVTSMIAVWIAMPQARKFFSLLIISVFGVFLSTAENNLASKLLSETAAVGTILVMYWKHRSALKKTTA